MITASLSGPGARARCRCQCRGPIPAWQCPTSSWPCLRVRLCSESDSDCQSRSVPPAAWASLSIASPLAPWPQRQCPPGPSESIPALRTPAHSGRWPSRWPAWVGWLLRPATQPEWLDIQASLRLPVCHSEVFPNTKCQAWAGWEQLLTTY